MTTTQDGRRERWTSHRAERHREFVDAAVRVLAGQGPELSMDAVAAEAGVTKPVLYRYFQDKSALVRALDERGTELLFSRLLPAISADGPAKDRVRQAVGAYFAVIDEYPNLYWLIARQPAAVDPNGVPVDEHAEFVAGALAGIITEFLVAFDMDVTAAEPWAHGLTGLVRSSGEWWLRQSRPLGAALRAMSRQAVVEHVTQLVWAGLTGVLGDAGIVVDPEQPFSAARRDGVSSTPSKGTI